MSKASIFVTLGLTGVVMLFNCRVLGAETNVSESGIKIGVINDMSGPYASLAGKGSVVAAQMAIDDLKAEMPIPVELVAADHQLKVDLGVSIIKRWFSDEKVNVAIDIVHSAIALAAQQIAKSEDRIVIAAAVGADDFTGKSCTPNSAAWLYNTHALSSGLVKSLVGKGLDTFFVVAVDYTFGASMTADVVKTAESVGGKVVGVAKFPLNSSDFSSYLLQAQSSGAKVVLFAAGGNDLINLIKQAHEFGLTERGQTLATPLMFLTDAKGIGLEAASGLSFSTAFYWDRNEETRAWSSRFMALHGAAPTMDQAAVYSAVKHYLEAVKAAGTLEARAVMMKMRELPVNDMFVHGGMLRADGRLLHPMYLVQIKRPEESHGPWDLFKVLSTIPADQAFESASASDCPLLH